MKITVAIPAYNEEKDIKSCLSSILSCDFPKENLEVIVVDNNSTDKTAEIAESLGVKVVKEKRQGNTFAVSTASKSGTGEVIAMLDADTEVYPNWLSEVEYLFNNSNIVGATGPADYEPPNRFYSLLYYLFLKFNFTIGKPHLTGFNMVVRRSALEKIGGIDENFTMSPDVDLGLRLKKVGKVVLDKKLKVITSLRRWNEDSIRTLYTYLIGYIYALWLRKPPPVRQNVVR